MPSEQIVMYGLVVIVTFVAFVKYAIIERNVL